MIFQLHPTFPMKMKFSVKSWVGLFPLPESPLNMSLLLAVLPCCRSLATFDDCGSSGHFHTSCRILIESAVRPTAEQLNRSAKL